jgi:AcrR family transcriptional regulator
MEYSCAINGELRESYHLAELNGEVFLVGSRSTASAARGAFDQPSRRGRLSQRDGRIEFALDAAARVLNAEGLTNASLDAVARELGISKSALYYYFDSKEDLVFKSYLRACQVACAAVDAAANENGSGRERFTSYIRRQLSPANPPVAFVSEIEFLEPEHREELRVLTRHHHNALLELLQGAIADGSLCVPNPTLLTYSIIGSLNWIAVWLRPSTGTLTLNRIADAYLDLFINGLSPSDRSVDSACPDPVHIGASAPASAFDRVDQAALRRDALVRASSEFFNRNGFDNCTLEDISTGLGISRSALYHYVSSKEALLHAAIDRSLGKTEYVMTTIAAEPLDGLSRIKRTISSAVDLHVGPAGPIANYSRLKALTREHALEVRARSERLEAILASFFALGEADGSVRAVDTRLARLALLGAINWLPKWYVPTGPLAPSAVAASLNHLFVNGLAPRPD